MRYHAGVQIEETADGMLVNLVVQGDDRETMPLRVNMDPREAVWLSQEIHLGEAWTLKEAWAMANQQIKDISSIYAEDEAE